MINMATTKLCSRLCALPDKSVIWCSKSCRLHSCISNHHMSVPVMAVSRPCPPTTLIRLKGLADIPSKTSCTGRHSLAKNYCKTVGLKTPSSRHQYCNGISIFNVLKWKTDQPIECCQSDIYNQQLTHLRKTINRRRFSASSGCLAMKQQQLSENDSKTCQSHKAEPSSWGRPDVTNSEKQKDMDESMSDRVADLKAETNIWTVPNLLTTFRMAISPVIGYQVLHEQFTWACSLFVIAGFTDMLDGYIARRFPSQLSALGSFIDPLADKLLISILFVTLTMVDLIPLPLTALIVARDIALILAGHYVRYISLTPPITFTRFYDVTNATAKLQPTTISKVNTVVQLSLVAVSLAAPVVDCVGHPYLQALWFVTAGSTIASALSYVIQKNTFKIKSKN